MTKEEEAKHFSDIFKAAAAGKHTQYKVKNGKSWKDLPDLPLDTWKLVDINLYEFRIKPEPKYRPYVNTEEFLNAQKEHGPYILNGNIYIIPVCIHPAGIGFSTKDDLKSYQRMMDYKWQDGHPCCIMEEQ